MILFVVCLTYASSANAGYVSKDKRSYPKWSVSGYFGTATYAMTDLNAFIEAGNERVGAQLVDPIESGTEYGFRLDANINRHWALGFSYTAFKAQTGFGPVSGSGDFVEIDARGNSFEMSLGYTRDLGAKFSWGVAAGVGRIKADGHIKESWGDNSIQYQYRGAGWGPAGRVMIEYQFQRAVFLWLEGGARQAETGTVQHGEWLWLAPDGQGLTFSYTGAFLHVGLRFTSQLLD